MGEGAGGAAFLHSAHLDASTARLIGAMRIGWHDRLDGMNNGIDCSNEIECSNRIDYSNGTDRERDGSDSRGDAR